MKSSEFWNSIRNLEISMKGCNLSAENHRLIVKGLSMKRKWMLHEVDHKDIFDFQKISNQETDCYIWDDAVRSQLKGFRYLKGIHILAVSPAIAEASQSQEDLFRTPTWEQIATPTKELHRRWFEENDASEFMSWNDIYHLIDIGCIAVAMHGYDHRKYDFSLTQENIKRFTEETEKGLELFKKRLGFKPTLYVWPYNEECYWADALLKRKFEMYSIGKGRLDARKAIQDIYSK